jgi:hypothetical protein
MAEDNNFKDLVKSMKANTEMATHNNDAIMNLNKTFSDYFTMLSRQTKDQEENSRESKKSTRVAKSSPKDNFGLGNNSMNFLGGFAGVGKTIALVTAGVASFGLAFAGLRGWELPALKALSKLTVISSQDGVIFKGIQALRAGALATFGFLNPVVPDPTRVPISMQIQAQLTKVKTGFLKAFGLGPNGLPFAERGFFGKGGTAVGKGGIAIGVITTQIGKLLKPLTDVGAGIGKFIGGAGADVFASIAKFGGSAGAWLGIVGKIFKPIGIIFSLKAAFDKFMESDKDMAGATGEGIAAFFSDFLGAPLDLLKSMVAWVFNKIGWDSAADALTKFSITNALFEAFNKILAIPAAMFRFFLTLFKSPKEAFKGLFEDILDITKPFRDLFKWFQDAITGWGKKVGNSIRAAFGLDPLEDIVYEGINQKQLTSIVGADKNKDGILSNAEVELAGTGTGGKNLRAAIDALSSNQFKMLGDSISYSAALLGEGLSVNKNFEEINAKGFGYNQFLNASTNVGDTINVHKYQGPSVPSMSAVDRRQLNQMKNSMMQ